MTDEKDKTDTEAPEVEAEGPVGGERLAEARRAKQISVLETTNSKSSVRRYLPRAI
jgi:hypothetical protein